jgi:p-aminobenzoyl-glutamate transporter AbgT
MVGVLATYLKGLDWNGKMARKGIGTVAERSIVEAELLRFIYQVVRVLVVPQLGPILQVRMDCSHAQSSGVVQLSLWEIANSAVARLTGRLVSLLVGGQAQCAGALHFDVAYPGSHINKGGQSLR